MDPLSAEAVEREAEKEAKRKIQFSVPSAVPTQLDPRQVEMIRRRRPTPATLFRMTDPPSPEEDSTPHQWVLGENGVLKAKLVNASTYQPPSLKAVQRMAQAHLSSIDMTSVDNPSSSDEEGKKEEKNSQQRVSDAMKDSKPLRDPSASPDSLTGSVALNHGTTQEVKEREEEKVEEIKDCRAVMDTVTPEQIL